MKSVDRTDDAVWLGRILTREEEEKKRKRGKGDVSEVGGSKRKLGKKN